VNDRPRLLAKQSQFGYTEDSARALPGEPEAVDAATQARFTIETHRREEELRRQAWAEARHHLIDGVRIVRTATPAMPKRIINSLRVVERTVARIDSELRRLE
jgi:hypothetical protein